MKSSIKQSLDLGLTVSAQVLCRQYCRRIRRSLFCPEALRRPVLSQLEEAVLFYLEEHPQAGMDELYAYFGTPKAFASNVLENMEGEQLRKQLIHYRWRRILTAALVTMVLAYGVFYCTRLAIDYIFFPGYAIVGSAEEDEGPIPTSPPD